MPIAPVRQVRRGGARRKVPNRRPQPIRLYGFLATLDGPPEGPWYATFECTSAPWLERVLSRHGPLEPRYQIDEVRRIMNGGTFEETWERSIAHRVYFRHLFDAYTDELAKKGGPLRLAVFTVTLEDPPARFGVDQWQVGSWYGLELRPSGQDADPADGLLAWEDPNTDELDDPRPYRAHIAMLRERSGPALFVIGTPFHSQATLRALHCL
ncbi:MAG: hypothetical protein KC619_24205 [Myxococcales bacterium]|nr:hypothetical protein [Myxococcales bacterium]